ncbi:MAG: hypothetical protein EHM45_15345 [Desulfobacteraceae bacterium]|nr:MAG: hypothetical protein EHM45_15345 [Desulfobacteraceae bacterium]
MAIDSSRPKEKNEDIVGAIFRQKEEFHRRQARLPIEEKIRILIELQKIAITIRPGQQPNERRQVWRIN